MIKYKNGESINEYFCNQLSKDKDEAGSHKNSIVICCHDKLGSYLCI